MAETVEQAEGRIDVLVNNFGTSDPRTDLDIARTRYEDFLDTLDKNLSSVFLSTQAVLPAMRKQGGGSIVNISSIGGILPELAMQSARTPLSICPKISPFRRAETESAST